jgi:hypothetical protein
MDSAILHPFSLVIRMFLGLFKKELKSIINIPLMILKKQTKTSKKIILRLLNHYILRIIKSNCALWSIYKFFYKSDYDLVECFLMQFLHLQTFSILFAAIRVNPGLLH